MFALCPTTAQQFLNGKVTKNSKTIQTTLYKNDDHNKEIGKQEIQEILTLMAETIFLLQAGSL
jgi:hypothetical protein